MVQVQVWGGGGGGGGGPWESTKKLNIGYAFLV